MYSGFQLAAKYLSYWLTASNGRGHGIHSPFLFDFVQYILRDKRPFYAYKDLEAWRAALLNDHTTVQVEDLGAGSVMLHGARRSIAAIAKHSAKSPKLVQLLFRMAHSYRPATIVELGTSLGISTAYLALGNPAAKLLTIEGAPALAERARQHFKHLSLDNVEVLTGSFEEKLPELLRAYPTVDMVFVDGNHRKGPTLAYFNLLLGHMAPASVIVFDDIHWSPGMEEAWSAIQTDPRVLLTVDLFHFGLVFFRKDFKVKQQFTIRF